jgi:hypothetical protein
MDEVYGVLQAPPQVATRLVAKRCFQTSTLLGEPVHERLTQASESAKSSPLPRLEALAFVYTARVCQAASLFIAKKRRITTNPYSAILILFSSIPSLGGVSSLKSLSCLSCVAVLISSFAIHLGYSLSVQVSINSPSRLARRS